MQIVNLLSHVELMTFKPNLYINKTCCFTSSQTILFDMFNKSYLSANSSLAVTLIFFKVWLVHSSTLGSRVWGKGDCCPFESPAVTVNTTSSGASIEELKSIAVSITNMVLLHH